MLSVLGLIAVVVGMIISVGTVVRLWMVSRNQTKGDGAAVDRLIDAGVSRSSGRGQWILLHSHCGKDSL
jgi:hypothetical protein